MTKSIAAILRSDIRDWLSLSGIVLALTNLIPLGGVLLLFWDVFPVVFLYWFENVIVGFYNVLRMIWARPDDLGRWLGKVGRWLGKVFMVPFFIVHYGMFTAIHGLFVFVLFGGGFSANEAINIELVLRVIQEYGIEFAALALVLSHGFSFVWNYIQGGEYRRVKLEALMHRPYTRIVVLHLTVLFGGFLVMAAGSPVAGLLLLVALKTGVDLRAHAKEHQKLKARALLSTR